MTSSKFYDQQMGNCDANVIDQVHTDTQIDTQIDTQVNLDIYTQTNLDISHELRTPLTAIQGAIGLLSSGRLDPHSQQGRRMLEIAANNADRLMRLTTAIEHHPISCLTFLSTEELAKLRLETDLRLAIAHNELRLQYQPIVSLMTGAITGFEVLLRWQHPTLGLVPPMQFIPIAEATGSIIEIGAWVLRQACQQLSQWQQKFPADVDSLTISVNLSVMQLDCADLALQIRQILQETGLAAQSLKLELTETAVMGSAETAKEILGQLRALGVQLYIDDFGTGYSSLTRLYDLPLNVLKIDRAFVEQINSERGEYLVRAIVNLAQNLGIDVIAEGVETKEQVLKLRLLGCYRGQGFLFARPLESETVAPFIQSWNAESCMLAK
jgi:c-di-GMP phosphodiesterase